VETTKQWGGKHPPVRQKTNTPTNQYPRSPLGGVGHSLRLYGGKPPREPKHKQKTHPFSFGGFWVPFFPPPLEVPWFLFSNKRKGLFPQNTSHQSYLSRRAGRDVPRGICVSQLLSLDGGPKNGGREGIGFPPFFTPQNQLPSPTYGGGGVAQSEVLQSFSPNPVRWDSPPPPLFSRGFLSPRLYNGLTLPQKNRSFLPGMEMIFSVPHRRSNKPFFLKFAPGFALNRRDTTFLVCFEKQHLFLGPPHLLV